MSASLPRETGDIYLLRLGETFLRSKIAAVQDQATVDMGKGVKPRILALLEDFVGFERGAAWGELEFLFSHINDIARIAIVGDMRDNPRLCRGGLSQSAREILSNQPACRGARVGCLTPPHERRQREGSK